MNMDSLGPLEEVKCALCGSDLASLIAVQRWFAEEFHIVRCKKCNLIYTNPRPTQIWRERFYDVRYNPYMRELGRDYIYKSTPERTHGYKILFRFIRNHVGSGLKLLDCGAATGESVKVATEEGFDAYGLEYSHGAVACAKKCLGLKLIQGSVENAPIPDNTYDIVTLLHIVEHFPDPLRALQEVRRILKPGGLLFIETPNYLKFYILQRYFANLIPVYLRLYSRKSSEFRGLIPWFPFDHYYHWTPRSLLTAIKATGFEQHTTHIIRDYNYKIYGTEARLSLYYRLYVKTVKRLLQISRHRLNLWGVLIATARKPLNDIENEDVKNGT
jgi:ubiquinone/menaquinone biosynthesis C-methylase UbiE